MAKSVFAMRLVNLWSVTCYTDHNFKSNCSFHSSKYLYIEKRFKESYKTSVNLEDMDHFKTLLNFFGVYPKIIRRVYMEFSSHNWTNIWQVGLLDVVLLEYPDLY